MNKILVMSENLYVALTKKKGRAVFANKSFAVGDIVETAIAIPLSVKEQRLLHRIPSLNYFYLYDWKEDFDEDKDGYLFPTGTAPFYNSSSNPNMELTVDDHNGVLIFKALRGVRKDEELSFDYEVVYSP